MLCVTIKLETLILTFGVSVGKKHHRLWPEMRAFQAEVPSGSMWIPVPDLFMSNQFMSKVRIAPNHKGLEDYSTLEDQ